MLCAGDVHRSHLEALLFDGPATARALGRRWLWRLDRAFRLEAEGAALAFVDVRPPELRFLDPRCGFYVPSWVLGHVSLPFDAAAAGGDSLRSDLRRIRRNGLRWDLSLDPAHREEFYERMYVPFILRGHGPGACLTPRAEIEAKGAAAELVRIFRGDEWVGGVLIDHDRDPPALWCIGLKDGDPSLYDCGAIPAGYLFALERIASMGHARASLGMSRPFLRDGVLRYKRKWSSRIVGCWPSGFFLKVLEATPAARAFLREQPFVFRLGEALVPAFFADGHDPLPEETLARIAREGSHPGLARVLLQRFPAPGAPEQVAVPASLGDRLEIRRFDLPRSGSPSS